MAKMPTPVFGMWCVARRHRGMGGHGRKGWRDGPEKEGGDFVDIPEGFCGQPVPGLEAEMFLPVQSR